MSWLFSQALAVEYLIGDPVLAVDRLEH